MVESFVVREDRFAVRETLSPPAVDADDGAIGAGDAATGRLPAQPEAAIAPQQQNPAIASCLEQAVSARFTIGPGLCRSLFALRFARRSTRIEPLGGIGQLL